MRYVNLHCHTHYSSLDGIGSPEEYMGRAAEIGMTHLAITDHGNLMGHREWQREAKKAGITPILGMEGYQTNDKFDRTSQGKRAEGDKVYNHLTLLAMNTTGLANLNKISDVAWNEGFYQKPRFDFDDLEQHGEGIIALSGCMSGMIPKAIEIGDDQRVHDLVTRYMDIFGDRFFIEVMSANELSLNKALLDIADKYGIKPVVTDDCHHVRKEDLWVQEATLILNTNPQPIKDFDFKKAQKMDFLDRFNYMYPERKMSFEKFDLFLHTYKDQQAALEKQGIGIEPIENTMIIAEMIEDYPYFEGLDLLPSPKVDAKALLRKKVFSGLRKMGVDKDPVYIDRANHELGIIGDKNHEPYFLISENAVTWAKGQGIKVGPGRGSAAGSLICRALEITMLDPIKEGLLFFRFMDPDRDDWPDVDIDFQDSRRHEVKDYMRRKFKEVASIATITYWKDNQVVKDAARVFKVPLGETNRALKNVNTYESFLSSPLTLEYRKKYPEVITLCDRLRGHIKSTGMHAGGIVVSKEPISNYVPIQTSKDNGDPLGRRVPLVGVDMKEAENIGLIKFDFLGLKSLSVLADAERLIRERHDPEFDLYNLDTNDAETYKMLSQGYTKMVFQCEQAAYTKTIFKMGGVHNFDELVASNALVRPGASNSVFFQQYLDGKAGNYDYIHADVKHFTESTYSSILYQEQQMLLCTELCGMSMKDANKVRRAIGKKKLEELEVWEDAFVNGAAEKIGKVKAKALWNNLLAASDYSFNLSHAVAYSLISYWTAYLKRHYTIEFVTATLHHEKEKDSILDYLIEAKRLGIKIKLPHVNTSGVNFEIQGPAWDEYIRIGLSNIKFISDITAPRIIQSRPFRSYGHLVEVINEKGNGLTANVLKGCNAIGAAEFFDNPKRGDEKSNFYEYLNIPSFEVKDLDPLVKEKFRPLDEYDENDAFICMGMVREVKIGHGKGWARVDFVDETGTASAFTTEHTPIEKAQIYVFLIASNRIARFMPAVDIVSGPETGFTKFLTLDTLDDVPEGSQKVISFKVRDTKAGKKMANAVFSDNEKNFTSAMVFPGKQFMKIFSKCSEGSVVKVQFRETEDGSIFVHDVE